MQDNIYIQAILNGFSVENIPYIIYGTGKIADIFYEKIAESTSSDNVLGFINEKLDIKEYQGKQVMKCSELPKEYIENSQVKYIIATVSKIPLFCRKLSELGISSDRMIKSTTIFSCDCFEEDDRNISRVVLYPAVTDLKVLREKMQEFDDIAHSDLVDVIYLIDEKNTFMEMDKQDNLCKISQYSYLENDLIWVWDANRVMDDFVKESNQVICCDGDFLYHSVQRMHTLLNNKIYKDNLSDLSHNNYIRMQEEIEGLEYATVCGTGPSLLNMSEENAHIVKNGCVIVCNKFYDVKCDWVPHIYVLQDNHYMADHLRDVMDKIAEYVIKNHVYLIVDSKWLNTILYRYPSLRDLVIGLEQREQMCYPTVDDLCYFPQDNVVPAMGIPVALGLRDRVYIIGCDGGTPSGAWEHANGEIIKNNTFGKRFLELNGITSMKNYAEYVDSLFRKIIKYGEERKKSCYSLVTSAYEQLNERIYKGEVYAGNKKPE